MARNQVQVTCAAGAWTQLTNGDVTNITFQAQDEPVFIRFTTDETTPTEAFGLVYGHGANVRRGEFNAALTGLTALVGADRVWAKPVAQNRQATVYVDHA